LSICEPSIICLSSGSNNTRLNIRQKWANCRDEKLSTKEKKLGMSKRLKVSSREARISSNRFIVSSNIASRWSNENRKTMSLLSKTFSEMLGRAIVISLKIIRTSFHTSCFPEYNGALLTIGSAKGDAKSWNRSRTPPYSTKNSLCKRFFGVTTNKSFAARLLEL